MECEVVDWTHLAQGRDYCGYCEGGNEASEILEWQGTSALLRWTHLHEITQLVNWLVRQSVG